ncbi:MAG: DUF3343 domain-containing protein [Thermoleophilia bacterium]
MTPAKDNSQAPDGGGRAIFLFDTTHAAMEAEQLIIDAGFWCDVVPRPPGTMSSLCGLAIEVMAADAGGVRNVLISEGIPFEIYQPEVEAH